MIYALLNQLVSLVLEGFAFSPRLQLIQIVAWPVTGHGSHGMTKEMAPR
jgi:hypothetical protein